jgi:methylthioribose-1-phosphate isomerase
MTGSSSKRVVVRTAKAASALAGQPVVVVKAATKLGSKRARPTSVNVLNEAVRADSKTASATAAAAAKKHAGSKSRKIGKKDVTSTKKLAAAARKADKAASGRWV